MPSNSLPRWQCHKVVTGSAIASITEAGDQYQLALACGAVVAVDRVWCEIHKPEVGGYFVRYNDGYESYSPSDVFQEGYGLLPPRLFDTKRKQPVLMHGEVSSLWFEGDCDRYGMTLREEGDVKHFAQTECIDGRLPRVGDIYVALDCDKKPLLFVTKQEYKERFVLEYRADAK